MTNTLVQPSDLASYPGAPFSESIVDAAVDRLRRDSGWHIAPQVTETLKVDGHGGRLLVLPTLQLVNVTAVRDVSGDTPQVLDEWKRSRIGILTRDGGWPCGLEAVEVDLVHGYTTTPLELFAVVADLCRATLSDPRVQQERLGNWSRTLRGTVAGTDLADILARYSVESRFA